MRGSDRCADAVEVEVERRRLELDAHRLAAGGEGQQLVEEPGRREEDQLVAGVEDRPHRDGDRRESAVRHRHVARVPGHAGPRGQRIGHDPLRLRLAELVGEPVLVLRLEVLRSAAT